MIVKNALVEKEMPNGRCTVKIPRKEACDNCNACGMFKNDHFAVLEAENSPGAKTGQRVAVEIIHTSMERPLLLLYGMPLLALLLFGAAGYLFTPSLPDSLRGLAALLAGALGVGVVYMVIAKKDKQGAYSNCISARITEIQKEE